MNMFKVSIVNADNTRTEVHLNPTMIGAVMASPMSYADHEFTRIVMSGGQTLDVDDKVEDILARLALS